MNKVLLLYPSFLNMEEKIKKTLYTDLPLSIITLSAQLVNQGYEVEVIDQCLEDFEYRSLEKKLNGCFLVGISAITSYQIINGLKFAGMIKQYNKSIKIVWGGWHASLMPEQTIHHENVDIVIKGPGEEQIVDVADCIKNRRSLNYVPNIYFKTPDGEIKKTQEKIYDTFQLKNNITDGYKTVDVERYVHAQWGNQRVLKYGIDCFEGVFTSSVKAFFENARAYEDARNVIGELRNKYYVGLISNADNDIIYSSIKKEGFQFDFIVTSEDARSNKPDQKIFLRAMQLLNRNNTDLYMIGDSQTDDICGAGWLNIPAIWINRNHENLREGNCIPEHTIHRLSDLLSIFS